MTSQKISDGEYSIVQDGENFSGLKLAEAEGRNASIFAGLRGLSGTLISLDDGSVEAWKIAGFLAIDGDVIVYGPALEKIRSFSSLPGEGKEGLARLSDVLGALKRLRELDRLPSRGLLLSAFFSVSGGRVLVLPEEIQALMLGVLPAARRFDVYDSLHQPSLSGEASYAFSCLVLAFRLSFGSLPFEYSGDATEYSHRVLNRVARMPRFFDAEIDANVESIYQSLDSERGNSDLATAEKAILLLRKAGAGKRGAPDAIQAYEKKKARYRSRVFFRRYGVRIFIIGIIALAVLSIPTTMLVNHFKPPLTQGMNADQVVEAFYGGINSLNNQIMDDATLGSAGNSLKDQITNLYVLVRYREAVEGKKIMYTPDEWIQLGRPELDSGLLVFGQTNLQIDTDSSIGPDRRNLEVSYDMYSNLEGTSAMATSSQAAAAKAPPPLRSHYVDTLVVEKNQRGNWAISSLVSHHD